MSTAELQEIVARLAKSQEETDRQMKETDRQMKETDRQMKETDRQMKETDRQMKETHEELKQLTQQTDRQLKELGKQIGGLGNKFGTFAEGLAFSSIRRVLRETFGMETITPRFEIKRGNESEEYDVLAYSNGGKNQGVIVEVKSLLDFRAIAQMERKMDRLFDWLPEHRDKAFQGIVAYVDGGKDEREAAIEKGWHLIHVGEDLFQLETKEGFQPRMYRCK